MLGFAIAALPGGPSLAWRGSGIYSALRATTIGLGHVRPSSSGSEPAVPFKQATLPTGSALGWLPQAATGTGPLPRGLVALVQGRLEEWPMHGSGPGQSRLPGSCTSKCNVPEAVDPHLPHAPLPSATRPSAAAGAAPLQPPAPRTAHPLPPRHSRRTPNPPWGVPTAWGGLLGPWGARSSSCPVPLQPQPPPASRALATRPDPSGLPPTADLPDLAVQVGRHVVGWAASGDTVRLRAAFSRLGQLGVTPGAPNVDPKLRRLTVAVFQTLTAAYLPLVPRLRDAFSCVAPLYVCGKLGLWEDGEALALALALLRRLDEPGLLQRAIDQGHSNLWWAVSTAPPEVVDAAAGVLQESAACLLRMKDAELTGQACSNVQLACARLQWRKAPELIHRLTARLVASLEPDAACQDLANSAYGLAEGNGRHDREALAREEGPDQRSSDWQQTTVSLQALTNSLWALAELGCTGKEYAPAVQSLCAAAVRQMTLAPGSFQTVNISQLFYALALLRCHPPKELLRAMAAGGQQGILGTLRARADSQACANILWALAKLGLHSEQQLVGALAERLGELLRSDRDRVAWQALANSLWALAVMGPEVLVDRHCGMVEGLLREAVRRWDANGPDVKSVVFKDLYQLWRVQQVLEGAASNGNSRAKRLASILESSSRAGMKGGLLAAVKAAAGGKEAARAEHVHVRGKEPDAHPLAPVGFKEAPATAAPAAEAGRVLGQAGGSK